MFHVEQWARKKPGENPAVMFHVEHTYQPSFVNES